MGVQRTDEVLADAASVVVVGDRENDIYSCFGRRPERTDRIVRAAQGRAIEPASERQADQAMLFASATAWPELRWMQIKVAPLRRFGWAILAGS
jgi:hypothetical protein